MQSYIDLGVFAPAQEEAVYLERTTKYGRVRHGLVVAIDLDTYEYNKLYKKTYEYMRDNNMLHDKLHGVDCTGLDVNKQLVKVKKVIDKYAKY